LAFSKTSILTKIEYGKNSDLKGCYFRGKVRYAPVSFKPWTDKNYMNLDNSDTLSVCWSNGCPPQGGDV